jgi:membrane dipeptidase
MKRALDLVLCLLCCLATAVAQRIVSDAEVRQVHRSTLLIDTHNDVTSETVDGLDIGDPHAGRTDIPKLREGGIGAVFFAVYVDAQYVDGNRSAHRALEMIDTVRHDIVDRYPRDFALARTADDIEAARKQGKIAALMGIEGGHAIEDLRLLRLYYELGVRYMTLTHMNTNNWADASGDMDDPSVKRHNGLTDFGKDVVREMNRLGMMVDVSHVADKTFWDVLEVSRAPVFASHSSCRSISSFFRNMTDEMIVALAKKGGVIQINFLCAFVSQKSEDISGPQRTELLRRMREIRAAYPNDPARRDKEIGALWGTLDEGVPRATLADVVANIEHVAKIAGVDAVGIGPDYDGTGCAPEGIDDMSKFPALTRALLEKGYSADDIRKIYGGNTLRVMRAVEKASGAR